MKSITVLIIFILIAGCREDYSDDNGVMFAHQYSAYDNYDRPDLPPCNQIGGFDNYIVNFGEGDRGADENGFFPLPDGTYTVTKFNVYSRRGTHMLSITEPQQFTLNNESKLIFIDVTCDVNR